MRLDAIKHYSFGFVRELVQHLRNEFGKDFFLVGEYWSWNSMELARLIDQCAGELHLFDVQLLYNLFDLSTGKKKDLRSVFRGTLVSLRPDNAVVSSRVRIPTRSVDHDRLSSKTTTHKSYNLWKLLSSHGSFLTHML